MRTPQIRRRRASVCSLHLVVGRFPAHQSKNTHREKGDKQMKIMIVAAACAVLAVGCAHLPDLPKWPNPEQPDAPVSDTLPNNPSTPVTSDRVQEWYWARKDYDGTWRARFPTALAAQVDSSSYCMVDGTHRMVFRSWWRDQPGANRPSYTIQQAGLDLGSEVLVTLHKSDGTIVAWFRAARSGGRGRLP